MINDLTRYFNNLVTDKQAVLYHLTVSYKPIGSGFLPPSSAANRYDTLWRHFLYYLRGSKKIGHTWFRNKEPAAYVFLDEPASKYKTQNAQVKVRHATDDFHHHGILVVHPDHCAKVDVLCNSALIQLLHGPFSSCHGIKSIHFERINFTEEDIRKVSDYDIYHYLRNQRRQEFKDYGLLVYPKSGEEFSNRRDSIHWLKDFAPISRRTIDQQQFRREV